MWLAHLEATHFTSITSDSKNPPNEGGLPMIKIKHQKYFQLWHYRLVVRHDTVYHSRFFFRSCFFFGLTQRTITCASLLLDEPSHTDWGWAQKNYRCCHTQKYNLIKKYSETQGRNHHDNSFLNTRLKCLFKSGCFCFPRQSFANRNGIWAECFIGVLENYQALLWWIF